MTNPDELFAVNLLPALSWAFELYFKKGARFKKTGILEAIFPAGNHKELRRKKGEHEISIWISQKRLFVRSKCEYKKECSFNTSRIDARDREALKGLGWEETNSRAYFKTMTKWLLRMEPDFKLMVKALATVCDRQVKIPMKTKYGRTFQRFDEYRRNRWPEEATPDDKPRFMEELLVRVAFWTQSAAEVGALKETKLPTGENQ